MYGVMVVHQFEMLADLLPGFVMESHRQDETPYPPATLMQLVLRITIQALLSFR